MVCKKAMPLEYKAKQLTFQKEENNKSDDLFYDDLDSKRSSKEKPKKPERRGKRTSEEIAQWRKMDRENERANKNHFSRYNFHGKVDNKNNSEIPSEFSNT